MISILVFEAQMVKCFPCLLLSVRVIPSVILFLSARFLIFLSFPLHSKIYEHLTRQHLEIQNNVNQNKYKSNICNISFRLTRTHFVTHVILESCERNA